MSEIYEAPLDEDLYIHKNEDGTFDVSVNFAKFLYDLPKEELIDYFKECILTVENLSRD